VNPNYTNYADYSSFYRIIKANKAGTDWYHELFKQAPMTSHNISVDGSSEKGSYLFSFNYLNQQGTMINTYLKRFTVRSNAQYNITKNIRVGENMAASIAHNPRINDMTENNPIFFTVQLLPLFPVHDIMGNYAGVFGTPYNGINPVAALERTANNRTKGNRLFGNMYAEVDFLRHFIFRTSFGGENYSGANSSFNYPTYENANNGTISSYNQNSYSGFNWTWTNTLSFRKTFGGLHDVKVLVGTEAYQSKYDDMGATRQDYFSFDPNYVTLSSGSGNQFVSGGRSMESLVSQFGRVDYSFRDKYIMSATLRYDGSSKLINDHYGWFPAFSAGWRVSEEAFLKNVSWLNDLKLRGSWGIMGNQNNVPANNGFYTYIQSNPGSYYDIGNTNNTLTPGFQVQQIGNPDARWEKNINSNIGIDASLFGGQLEITADYYRKDVRDLLFNPPVPATQGAGNPPYVNIARMKNEGLDLNISSHQTVSKSWRFDETITFTTYNNNIEKVTDNTNYFEVDDDRHFGVNFIRNQTGQPVGSFYGYKIIGFWNSQKEVDDANALAKQATGNPTALYQGDGGLGRFRYADMNNDGQVTPDDRTFLGNPNPKFSYGINLRASYRNFDVSMFWYGVYGNELTNVMSYWTDFFANFAGTKSKTALYDSWRPDHTNAKAPIQEVQQYQSSGSTFNSYFVQNGAYLRLKNIQLGYTIPANLLSKAGIQKLRVYIQAANLLTLTNYTGLDPEVNGNGVTSFGIDEGIYNNQRTFIAGINLNF
jgi:TonB-linked SusC/RagA family outer membrane protein